MTGYLGDTTASTLFESDPTNLAHVFGHTAFSGLFRDSGLDSSWVATALSQSHSCVFSPGHCVHEI